MPGTVRFTETPECKYRLCSNEVKASFSYCQAHKCIRSKCNKHVTKPGYCDTCKCRYKDCSNNCFNDKTRYCQEHKCIVRDCTMRHARLNTRYCKSHDCREGEPNNLLCGNRRHESSIYCHDHVCCSKGCSSRRLADTKPFCICHGCSRQECPRKSIRANGFCSSHECIISDCFKGSRDSNTSYCIDHACGFETCSGIRIMDYTFRIEYCVDHAKCVICTSYRTGKSPYCNNHVCFNGSSLSSLEIPCTNRRRTIGDYCVSCKCVKESCELPRLPGFRLCQDCSCKYDNCISSHDPGSDYCHWFHRCSHFDAEGSRCSDPVLGYLEDKEKDVEACSQGTGMIMVVKSLGTITEIGGLGYCKDHMKCWTQGCNSSRVAHGLSCLKHSKCSFSTCSSRKHKLSLSYCQDHVCRNTWCDELRKENNEFCSSHACINYSCDDSSACELHRAGSPVIELETVKHEREEEEEKEERKNIMNYCV